MRHTFLFVRPPRPLWPFNGPSTAFWPPLAFCSLAAALRMRIPRLRVEILDAPVLKMGWKAVASEVARLKPQFVGIGEEAAGCIDALRVAALSKNHGAVTIAGGCFFAHVASELLKTGSIDVVVHGEGEETLPELVTVLQDGGLRTLGRVRGISFAVEQEIVHTQPRPLIAELDDLPFPAYDLLPMEKYGATSRNHRAFAAIELSRGCPQNCAFCILWRQMGKFVGGEVRSCFRTKSPERALEEIQVLTKQFGRRYLGWVDPCFNADPHTPARLAELLLRRNLHLGQSAWVRADYLLRDLRSGSFDPCAKSGLNELYIGIERTDPRELSALHKVLPDVPQTLALLSKSYPNVFTVGSFIYGLPGDTPRALYKLYRDAYKLPLDLNFFIPLTPLPGTPLWDQSARSGSWSSFKRFDFLPHASGRGRLGHLSLALYAMWIFVWPWKRLWREVASKFCSDARRRSISWRVSGRNLVFVLAGFLNGLLKRDRGGMRYPLWYSK